MAGEYVSGGHVGIFGSLELGAGAQPGDYLVAICTPLNPADVARLRDRGLTYVVANPGIMGLLHGPLSAPLSMSGMQSVAAGVVWSLWRGCRLAGVALRAPMYGQITWLGVSDVSGVMAVRAAGSGSGRSWRLPAGWTLRADSIGSAYIVASEVVSGSAREVIADDAQFNSPMTTVTVLLAPGAPSAPTITGPAAQVDWTVPQTISWRPDGVQTAYCLRRSTNGGASQWWTGTAWGASQVWVSGEATSVAGITGTNGGTDLFGVRTRSTSDRPGDSAEATVTVKGVASPPAPSVSVAPTTGGVLPQLTASVTVAGGAGAGGVLSGHGLRVERLGSTNLVYDDQVQTGSQGSHVFVFDKARPLPNDATLRFIGWTVQDGVQKSAETVTQVLVAAPKPPAPSLHVEQATHPDSGLPGIRVLVTTSWPTPLQIEIERAQVIDGDIGDWAPLSISTNQQAISMLDYVASGAVAYRARVIDTASVPTASAWAQDQITTASRAGWLVDPQRPETAQLVRLRSWGDRTTDLRTQAQATIHSGRWHVTSLVPTDRTGAMTVITSDAPINGGPSPLARLLTLLRSGRALTYTLPDERQPVHLYPGSEPITPGETVRMIPTGSIKTGHLAQTNVALREVSWDWAEQRED